MHRSALVRHSGHTDHIDAVKHKPLQSSMKKTVEINQGKQKDSHAAMLRTVYFMAKKELPDDMFSSLLELQNENKCQALSDGQYYKHHESVREMQVVIAKVLQTELDKEIAASPVISVIVDETVNITVNKKLIIFIRIVKNGEAKTVFSGNVTIAAGNAETVTEAILQQFERMNISKYKVVGLGSDVLELEEDARKNPTAEGLVRLIKPYSFIALTYTLTDVLLIMDRLNLLFQRESVNLSRVQPMVGTTIAALRDLLNEPMSGDSE
ncbi:uncharacterized protein C17orf113-like [Ptychodera flava]|uniref:uncharacterized protein C17orf113-like n=1 Tax=Ptychodera flava TaxID=63121 RepID=UPI00396A5BF3